MWVLGRTEHRSLGPGGRHLYLQSHLTPPSFKKESIHLFFFNRNLLTTYYVPVLFWTLGLERSQFRRIAN